LSKGSAIAIEKPKFIGTHATISTGENHTQHHTQHHTQNNHVRLNDRPTIDRRHSQVTEYPQALYGPGENMDLLLESMSWKIHLAPVPIVRSNGGVFVGGKNG
jgi:hypothetical protein